MKKLGFGLMRLPLLNPDDDASVDIEQLKDYAEQIFRAATLFEENYAMLKKERGLK